MCAPRPENYASRECEQEFPFGFELNKSTKVRIYESAQPQVNERIEIIKGKYNLVGFYDTSEGGRDDDDTKSEEES